MSQHWNELSGLCRNMQQVSLTTRGNPDLGPAIRGFYRVEGKDQCLHQMGLITRLLRDE